MLGSVRSDSDWDSKGMGLEFGELENVNLREVWGHRRVLETSPGSP